MHRAHSCDTLNLPNTELENARLPSGRFHFKPTIPAKGVQMATTAIQSIEERLDKLERQNRRLKQAGLLALIAITAIVLMGQSAPKSRTVEANSFVLTDEKGNMRADLSMVGGAGLTVYDSKGEPRGMFAVNEDGAFLTLKDAERQKGSVLTVNSDSVLLRRHGKIQARLFVDDDGPSLALEDTQGFESRLGVAALRTPLTGESSRTSAASLTLFDKDRKVIWRTP